MYIGAAGGPVKKAYTAIILDPRSQIITVAPLIRYFHSHFPEHNETFQKTVEESSLRHSRQRVAQITLSPPQDMWTSVAAMQGKHGMAG